MDWHQQLFHYCERGLDPTFWAEPFNAITNGAFFIAALAAGIEFRRKFSPQRSDGNGSAVAVVALIALTVMIGTGSFLFHTTATRWAMMMDSGAIAVFTVSYLGFALLRFAHAPWVVVILCMGAMFAAVAASARLPCDPELLPVTAAAGRAGLNGSIGYVPVLIAMVLVGFWQAFQGHPAARLILTAAAIFFVSLALRTLDLELCTQTALLGKTRGTHGAWHLLNGLAIYLLLRAGVRYGAGPITDPR